MYIYTCPVVTTKKIKSFDTNLIIKMLEISNHLLQDPPPRAYKV